MGCFLHRERWQNLAGLLGALPKWGAQGSCHLSPRALSPASPGRPAACAQSQLLLLHLYSSSSCACKGYSCPEKKVMNDHI